MKNKNKLAVFLLMPFLLTGCNNGNAQKEYKIEDYKIKMDYKSDFKIMQLTDLHFSMQTDFKTTTKYLRNNILTCSPDLIVVTGDTFMDANKSIVTNVLDFLDSFDIPFAFTYGNHDFQGDYDYYYVSSYVKTKKNAKFVDYEDDNIYGQANYFIDLMENDAVKYRLYIVDSNSYHFNGVGYSYDIIHEDQLKHLEDIYNEDGDAFGLAFYHIPLYETHDALRLYKRGEVEGQGEQREKVAYGYKRTDAFNRMKNIGIKAHFYGHDHINNADVLYQGVTLSYGTKSTSEIYHDDDLIGYKEIILKDDMSWSIENNLFNRMVKYEK